MTGFLTSWWGFNFIVQTNLHIPSPRRLCQRHHPNDFLSLAYPDGATYISSSRRA